MYPRLRSSSFSSAVSFAEKLSVTMKSVYVLLGLVAAASAFQAPMMATRAVAKPAPKKAAPAPKKVVAKAAPAPKPAAVPVVVSFPLLLRFLPAYLWY